MALMKILLRWILLGSLILVSLSLIVQATAAVSAARDEKNESAVALSDEAPAAGEQESPSIVENLATLGLLILLQAVLGFDNLLYISLESKHAPPEKQHMVRVCGIGLAIFFRIGLLFLLVYLKEYFETVSVFGFDWSIASGNFNLHSVIVLAGGVFIIYTAMKEIWHMIRMEQEGDHGNSHATQHSIVKIIFWIVLMNIVFSFDSILSAIALTSVLWVMAAAVILSGLMMIWLSDRVAKFLSKNRMYEVLGLFVLFVVGIMLVSEGGHLAHVTLFGNAVTPMTKTTFYFVLAVLVLTDIVQSRYQQKLMAEA